MYVATTLVGIDKQNSLLLNIDVVECLRFDIG